MKPILYEYSERNFTNMGLGALSPISYYIEEGRNGIDELTMQYSVKDPQYSYLQLERIILALPAKGKQTEPFRIYQITKPLSGVVTVYAHHVTYDLTGIPVGPFTETGATRTLLALVSNAMVDCPFDVWTNITNGDTTYTQSEPASFRSRLGGTSGSVLDCFGGEYEWNRFTVKLWAHRGEDRGVSIRYSKNLTALTDESSSEGQHIGAVAFYKTDAELVTGTVQYVDDYESYACQRVITLDATQSFDDVPTEEELNTYAANYLASNQLNLVSDNLKVSFVALWQTEEYKNIAPLEHVRLCDTVHIYHPTLGVDATAMVIRTVWDGLAERYTEIELGKAKSTLAQTLVGSVREEVEEIVNPAVSYFESQLEYATSVFQLGEGSNMYIGTNANGKWNEIYFLDTDNIATAVNVLRINGAGIAFSHNGYDPDSFNSAWTIDGTLNMQNINVVHMIADLIRGGTLHLGDFDGETGVMEVYNSNNDVIVRIDENGVRVNGTNGYVLMNEEVGFAGYDNSDNPIYWVNADEFHMKKAFSEEEFTLVQKMRFIPITIYDTDGETILNDGVGIVSTL